MKRIVEVTLGILLGQAIWGCLPFIFLIGLAFLLILAMGIVKYWWVIALVVVVVALLHIGINGDQRRHTAGFYASKVTGYTPRAYRTASIWRLKVINSDNSVRRVPISEAGCWVGRSRDCTLQLHDPTVSNHHCWIGSRDGYLQVRDANSRHGTKVNSQPVTKTILHPGDEIQVGRTRLQIRKS